MEQRFQNRIAYVHIIANVTFQAIEGFEPYARIFVIAKGGYQCIANVIVACAIFQQINGIKADIRITIAVSGQKQKLLNARIVR